MIKNFLKEVIIILFLCIAILLVLSIMFYDYNPITKVVPNKVAYTTPEDIVNILDEENINANVEIEKRVYTIDGSDLTIYQKSKTYDPSKENPFVSTPTSPEESTPSGEVKTNTNGTSSSSNSGSSSTSTSANTTSSSSSTTTTSSNNTTKSANGK